MFTFQVFTVGGIQYQVSCAPGVGPYHVLWHCSWQNSCAPCWPPPQTFRNDNCAAKSGSSVSAEHSHSEGSPSEVCRHTSAMVLCVGWCVMCKKASTCLHTFVQTCCQDSIMPHARSFIECKPYSVPFQETQVMVNICCKIHLLWQHAVGPVMEHIAILCCAPEIAQA